MPFQPPISSKDLAAFRGRGATPAKPSAGAPGFAGAPAAGAPPPQRKPAPKPANASAGPRAERTMKDVDVQAEFGGVLEVVEHAAPVLVKALEHFDPAFLTDESEEALEEDVEGLVALADMLDEEQGEEAVDAIREELGSASMEDCRAIARHVVDGGYAGDGVEVDPELLAGELYHLARTGDELEEDDESDESAAAKPGAGESDEAAGDVEDEEEEDDE